MMYPIRTQACFKFRMFSLKISFYFLKAEQIDENNEACQEKVCCQGMVIPMGTAWFRALEHLGKDQQLACLCCGSKTKNTAHFLFCLNWFIMFLLVEFFRNNNVVQSQMVNCKAWDLDHSILPANLNIAGQFPLLYVLHPFFPLFYAYILSSVNHNMFLSHTQYRTVYCLLYLKKNNLT